MVLIISDRNDISSNIVIEWISYLGCPFYKLNPDDVVRINMLSLHNFEIIVNEVDIIQYSQIISTWFRRGFINFGKDFEVSNDEKFMKYLIDHLHNEQEAYAELIHFLLCNKRHIGTDKDYHINKFIQLSIATKFGLCIPDSNFVNRKSDLNKLIVESETITKSSNSVLDFIYNDNFYLTYTEKVNLLDLQKIPETFMLSYCQEHIRKICDIRVFYFYKKCYSMAIMSQDNSLTSIDFRKYDYINPNKSVPYKLPLEIEKKINILMDSLTLISGSLDFILDKNGNYIFLEINPIGQFGMVDFPCNYGLHKMIAEYLTFNI